MIKSPSRLKVKMADIMSLKEGFADISLVKAELVRLKK